VTIPNPSEVWIKDIKMIGADLVAQILKAEGVDFMGVIPFNRLEEAGAQAEI